MTEKIIAALKIVCGYCGYNTNSPRCPNCGHEVL